MILITMALVTLYAKSQDYGCFSLLTILFNLFSLINFLYFTNKNIRKLEKKEKKKKKLDESSILTYFLEL